MESRFLWDSYVVSAYLLLVVLKTATVQALFAWKLPTKFCSLDSASRMYPSKTDSRFQMVVGAGFEPALAHPKCAVLPLNSPTKCGNYLRREVYQPCCNMASFFTFIKSLTSTKIGSVVIFLVGVTLRSEVQSRPFLRLVG